jgi:hypothetical protein
LDDPGGIMLDWPIGAKAILKLELKPLGSAVAP